MDHAPQARDAWKNSTDDERQAAHLYQNTPVYRSIQDYLRGAARGGLSGMAARMFTSKQTKDAVKNLDSLIGKSSMPAMTVHRAGMIPGLNTSDSLSRLEGMVGQTFTEDGYSSSSTDPNAIEKFMAVANRVRMDIDVPAGAHGVSLNPEQSGLQTKWSDEQEILFARGSSYKIKDVSKDKDGRYRVRVSLDTDKLPKFGDGGVVTKPTLAMIGEKGPEAVVPLGPGAKHDGPQGDPKYPPRSQWGKPVGFSLPRGGDGETGEQPDTMAAPAPVPPPMQFGFHGAGMEQPQAPTPPPAPAQPAKQKSTLSDRLFREIFPGWAHWQDVLTGRNEDEQEQGGAGHASAPASPGTNQAPAPTQSGHAERLQAAQQRMNEPPLPVQVGISGTAPEVPAAPPDASSEVGKRRPKKKSTLSERLMREIFPGWMRLADVIRGPEDEQEKAQDQKQPKARKARKPAKAAAPSTPPPATGKAPSPPEDDFSIDIGEDATKYIARVKESQRAGNAAPPPPPPSVPSAATSQPSAPSTPSPAAESANAASIEASQAGQGDAGPQAAPSTPPPAQSSSTAAPKPPSEITTDMLAGLDMSKLQFRDGKIVVPQSEAAKLGGAAPKPAKPGPSSSGPSSPAKAAGRSPRTGQIPPTVSPPNEDRPSAPPEPTPWASTSPVAPSAADGRMSAGVAAGPPPPAPLPAPRLAPAASLPGGLPSQGGAGFGGGTGGFKEFQDAVKELKDVIREWKGIIDRQKNGGDGQQPAGQGTMQRPRTTLPPAQELPGTSRAVPARQIGSWMSGVLRNMRR